MILRFSLENWMSFRDRVDFFMDATRERQHGERVPRSSKFGRRILPVAALYGGNASGKSNFFKALNFAKNLVVRGTRPEGLIPVQPFLLEEVASHAPSSFRFEILAEESLYRYEFSTTRKRITEESLAQVKGSSESVLFERMEGKIEIKGAFRKDVRRFLGMVAEGTRENQLFLTNAVSMKVDAFRPVYEWFRDSLVLIDPDKRSEDFDLFPDEMNHLSWMVGDALSKMDTGIDRLKWKVVDFEAAPLPSDVKEILRENLPEGMSARLWSRTGDMFLVARRKDGFWVGRLVACHSRTDGREVLFEISQESDGTRRVLDLLPAFFELTSPDSRKVYVIDEIGRSLHFLLLRRLIEDYLRSCSDSSRAQLLFTTHDLLLMDQSLFRRDEMWVAERDRRGATTLFSFCEYKDIRYDKDIRKSYLQGRLGGLPRVSLSGIIREDPVLDEPGEAS